MRMVLYILTSYIHFPLPFNPHTYIQLQMFIQQFTSIWTNLNTPLVAASPPPSSQDPAELETSPHLDEVRSISARVSAAKCAHSRPSILHRRIFTNYKH